MSNRGIAKFAISMNKSEKFTAFHASSSNLPSDILRTSLEDNLYAIYCFGYVLLKEQSNQFALINNKEAKNKNDIFKKKQQFFITISCKHNLIVL